MQSMLRDYIDNTFKTFDQYPTNDPKIQAEIDELKNKYLALGEKTNDLGTFCLKAPESGLYEEYTRIMTKLVMARNAAETPQQTVRPTVRQFLDQYRPAYEEIKKDGTRPRGERAYENIFAVANQTDDLVTAEIILEENNLVWGLTYWDSLDIFEHRLKELDPLFKATTATLLNSIDAVRKSNSAEEYYYEALKAEVKNYYDIQDYKMRMQLAVSLALRLTEFCNMKRDFYKLEGKKDKQKKFILPMLAKRVEIRRLLGFLSILGLSYQALFADEGSKIWFLCPATSDEDKIGLGRTKETTHPQNYEVFIDILENEILPDLPLVEILKRRPDKVFWYKL